MLIKGSCKMGLNKIKFKTCKKNASSTALGWNYSTLKTTQIPINMKWIATSLSCYEARGDFYDLS